MQNGIDHAARVAPLSAARGRAGVVYYNGERLARRPRAPAPCRRLDLAVADDADGRALRRAACRHAAARAAERRISPRSAWRKLLINVVANPITALTLQRQAVFRRDDVHALCLAVLDEAVAVARADGARLADDEAARTMATLLTYGPSSAPRCISTASPAGRWRSRR